MNRRRFLFGTTGLVLPALGARTPNAAGTEPKPWSDPGYSALPTPEQQTNELEAAALAAQTKPRIVLEMPVTGLPLDLGKFDADMAARVKDAGIVGVTLAVAVDRRLA